jgi:transcription initiation factor TFIIIB Brf1 subunit/transcription initiation factor TFIIB
MACNPHWWVCSDCRAYGKFVWTNDGDIVCTACGLVKEGHVISDEPEWRFYEDDGPDKSRVEVIEEFQSKKATVVHRELLSRLLDIYQDSTIKECIDELYVVLTDYFKKNKKLLVAVISFIACKWTMRPVTPYNICYNMQMDYNQKDFWGMYNDVMEKLKIDRPRTYHRVVDVISSDNDINVIVRSLSQYFELKFDETAIIRVASDLLARTHEHMSCKMTKLSASVVYVACKALGYRICTQKYADVFLISQSTLCKHESSIQDILSRTRQK